MAILFVPNIQNRIQQYVCLDSQRKLNEDVISHILLTYRVRTICVNQKELVNILENKYQNYHFIRDYKANEITYFKPKKVLSKEYYYNIRVITEYILCHKENQTWE